MTDSRIIVKKDFTVRDIEIARMKRAAFRPSKFTSACSNVLNQVDLQKTVILCEDHSRMLKASASKYGYYRQREFPYVMGNCDHCKVFGRSDLYIHESVLHEVWTPGGERQRRVANATVVSG